MHPRFFGTGAILHPSDHKKGLPKSVIKNGEGGWEKIEDDDNTFGQDSAQALSSINAQPLQIVVVCHLT